MASSFNRVRANACCAFSTLVSIFCALKSRNAFCALLCVFVTVLNAACRAAAAFAFCAYVSRRTSSSVIRASLGIIILCLLIERKITQSLFYHNRRREQNLRL